MMSMVIPDFHTLDEKVDADLNRILHRALSRDVNARYPTADELLYDLEHYIYKAGYGPTNETLGKYIRELFGQNPQATAARTDASPVDQTTRIYARS